MHPLRRLPARLRLLPSYPATKTFLLTLLYIAAPLAYLTHNHATLHRIHGPSMSPLLSPAFHTTGAKDIVLFRRDVPLSDTYGRDPSAAPGTRREVLVRRGALQRGMVVAFDAPHAPERLAVKRVVAVEGDVVTPLPRAGEGRREGVRVPLGHVWVEGEDKGRSRDSNDYGPISKSLIVGVGTWVLWPRSRWGRVEWEAGGPDGWAGGRVRRREEEVFGIPEEWMMD